MKPLIKRILFSAALTGLGALAGYVYFHALGCGSGWCSVTGSSGRSMLYSALIGLALSLVLMAAAPRAGQETPPRP